MALARHPRALLRLASIALTLARHDALGPLIEAGLLPRPFGVARWFAGREARRQRPGDRLVAAAEALGPSFIKIGQLLSTRADLIGAELADDLSRLQDRLAPFAFDDVRATVEADLGQPIASLFQHFDEMPVAAASIAQVHFAETPDGAHVAVKVLRPGVKAWFDRDLALFDLIADFVERTRPDLRRLKPKAVVAQLREDLRFEMDLRFEAAAAAELAANFRDDPGFRVPRIDWARTARRVLTMERVGGLRVDEPANLVAAGLDPHEVMRNAATAFFNQVFRDGFFHADMHPGNSFVAPDHAIIAVDFGIMGRIDRSTRYFLADMLLAFLTGDYRKVAEVHFAAGYVPANQSVEAFAQAARSIGEPLLGRPLAEISVGRLLAQLFEVTKQFEMETQPQLLLLQKTMVVAEGVGRRLDPTVNMWTLAQPLIESWMRENRGPAARVRQSFEVTRDTAQRLPRLIGSVERIAGDLAAGGLKLHPDSLRALARDLDTRPRRVSLWPIALIVGLVIGMLLG
jgi:ubiquinone biosynthesis protein